MTEAKGIEKFMCINKHDLPKINEEGCMTAHELRREILCLSHEADSLARCAKDELERNGTFVGAFESDTEEEKVLNRIYSESYDGIFAMLLEEYAYSIVGATIIEE